MKHEMMIGIDLGGRGDDLDCTWTSVGHGLRDGDSLRFAGDTNRIRRRVVEVYSRVAFRFATFVRPSNGYARHVRRRKARSD